METSRKWTCIKRIIAYLMTIAMVLSTVDNTALYAYAIESDANIEILSETGTENGEENNYAGTEFTEDWEVREVSGFEINAWEMDENADFEAEALAILSGLEKTYDIVTLCYRSLADAVSKDLWNAAVAATDAGNKDYEQIRVNFGSGSEAPDENWCFNNVNEVNDENTQQLNMGITLNVSSESNGGATVQLDANSGNLYQYAEYSNISFSVDYANRQAAFEAMQTAFGTQSKELDILDSQGNKVHDGYYNYNSDENNSYIDINVDAIYDFNTGEAYSLTEKVYRGEIYSETWDDGYEFLCLDLHPGNINADTFTVEQITEILSYYEEKSFDEINLTYPSESMAGTVSKDVLNALLPYLKDSAEDHSNMIRCIFRDETLGTHVGWGMKNPQNQDADIEFPSLFTITDEKVTITTGSQSIKADSVSVTLCVNREKNAVAEKLVALFGSGEIPLSIGETSNGAHINGDASDVWIDLFDVNQLDANTTYEITKYQYKGNEFTENRDGNDFSGFNISVWDMEENADFETEALNILNGLEKTYDIITLTYGPQGNQVSKELWNVAVAVTDAGNKDYEQIRVDFINDTTQYSENWCLDNVYEITDEDIQAVNLGINYVFSEENGGGATIQLDEDAGNLSGFADNLNVNIGTDLNYQPEFYSSVQIAFGTESKNLEVQDNNGEVVTHGFYNCFSDDENSYADVNIDGIQNLNVGITYTISEEIYRGEYNTWIDDSGYEYVSLYMDPNRLDKDSFTVDEITSILSNYDKKTFDEITLVYSTDSAVSTVDKNAINATLAYLKDSTEDRASTVSISFRSPTTGNCYNWNLVNPQEQTEDQTLSVTLNVLEEGADFWLDSQTLKADQIDINISINKEGDFDTASKLEEIYGTGWVQLSLKGADCWAAIEGDDWSTRLMINDINQLTPNMAYSVVPYQYIGSIDTWDDGTRELFINFWDNNGEGFTEEQLVSILDNYTTGHGLGSIYINQPRSESNTIYKSVADKACDLLEYWGTVKFAFTDPNTDQFVEWHLQNVNPDTEQIADQEVNAGLIMSESDSSVYVSVAEQELVAENVMILFGTSRMNEGENADEFIMGIFGEEPKEIETEGGETAGWYGVDEWNVFMEFYDPSALVGGEFYKVIPKTYRGDVDEFEENGEIIRSIYLSSFGIEADAFTEASFRATIQYYIDKDIKFDHIFIEQKYSSNNIIKKELINAAREIMKDTGMSSVDFGFCACIGEEYDENGDITQEFIQNDMIWELQNPGYAYEDIDANISLISKGNAGLSVVLKENYYDVENINLNFNISPETGIYKEVLVPTFGEATYEQSEPLVVLENVSDLRTDIGAFYNLNPENDLVSFYLCGMQDWAQETDNRLVKCDYTTLVIPVGQTVDINFANVPDVGVLEVNSLTPDIISVNKTERNVEITALLAGEQGYFLAAYPMDGKECIEVISVWTSLEETLEIPYIPYIAAVPGVEQTLADIDLNKLVFGDGEANGSFAWVDPTIELAPLANTDFHTFGAIYTNKKGKKANVNIVVNMIRAEEIFLFKGVTYDEEIIPEELNGTTMKVGEELVIGTDVWFNNDAIGSYLESGKVLLQWSSKETLTDATEYFGVMDVPKKYIATKKGKKVFTLSVVSKKTGKVLLSKSATVNVVGKDLFSFESPDFEFVDVVNENEPMKGTFAFIINPDNYEIAKKISVKSEDSSVLKLDKAVVIQKAGEPVIIEVGYTFKKYGKTAITVTTADEMKSKISYTCERVDYEPKLLNTSFTFDKTWKMDDIIFTELPIAYQRDTYLNDTIRITGESADKFEIIDNFLILNDMNIKEKTYTLTLEIPVMIPDTETVQTYNQTIKVKVTKTNPKVTIKQTKKVNEFYKNTFFSTEGAGRITINAGEYEVLVPHIVEENSRFMIFPIEGTNDYYIMLGENSESEGKAISKEEKTVTIAYILESDTGMLQRTTSFTIKTENKKPSLITSDKDTTLYPNVGYVDAKVEFINKKTNEMIMPYYATIEVVLNKKTGETYTVRELENTDSFIKIGKNNYKIYSEGEDICIILDKTNFVKSTDKITFRIKQDDYGKPVDVTYTVKVDNKVPKIKLSNKTLTLNANADVYKCQTAETKVEVTGFKNLPVYDEIKFIGLEDKFNFDYNEGSSVLTVTFKDKVTPGNYKCKVETKILDQVISTDLTIKVVDKSVAKAVKVSKKGSIDVLRRETTMITMNPKFTNLSGEIIDFELKGPDADMFNAYYDAESGNCVVKVKSSYSWEGRQEYNFSTKYNYKVIPVYVLEDNGIYLVEGAQQKVKLTQSKPKLTVSSNSTILYADKGNNMIMDFKAVSKGEEIAIKEVRLLNYVNDLYWNSETGELGVYDVVSEMKKAKGKYTLKFEVIYTDKAGNEKTAQTSYKVTVVR